MSLRRLLLAGLMLAAACGDATAGSSEAAAAGNAAVPAGPGDTQAAGRYRLRGEPDVASELELRRDGSFRYFLIAGAVDRHSEGRWTSDGRSVTLDTEPRPTPPVFTAGPVTQTREAALAVTVNAPNGEGIALIDVRVGLAGGRVIEGYTQDHGWHMPIDEPPGAPVWVELRLDMFGVPPRRFPVDAGAGNSFAFTFTPNDLRIADFRDLVALITDEGLLVNFPEGPVPYRRER